MDVSRIGSGATNVQAKIAPAARLSGPLQRALEEIDQAVQAIRGAARAWFTLGHQSAVAGIWDDEWFEILVGSHERIDDLHGACPIDVAITLAGDEEELALHPLACGRHCVISVPDTYAVFLASAIQVTLPAHPGTGRWVSCHCRVRRDVKEV